MGWQKRFVICE